MWTLVFIKPPLFCVLISKNGTRIPTNNRTTILIISLTLKLIYLHTYIPNKLSKVIHEQPRPSCKTINSEGMLCKAKNKLLLIPKTNGWI